MSEIANDPTENNAAAKLRDLLDRLPVDDRGNVVISEQNHDEFKNLLVALDLTAEPLSDEEIRSRAEWMQAERAGGNFAGRLARNHFIDETSFYKLVETAEQKEASLDRPVNIDPIWIVGAAGFASWLGRGYEGQQLMQDRQTGELKSSLELINDYASRPTPLPPVGLDVMVRSDNRAMALSTDAHRAAAAKARGEPLAVNRLRFFFK